MKRVVATRSIEIPFRQTVSNLFRKGVERDARKLRSNHTEPSIKVSDDAVQIHTKNEPAFRCRLSFVSHLEELQFNSFNDSPIHVSIEDYVQFLDHFFGEGGELSFIRDRDKSPHCTVFNGGL